LYDFINYFNALSDPCPPGKVIYPLQEVLRLSLLATLAGIETFVDMALFGRKKRELLRRFLPFKGGTASHDHLGDRFATLDAEPFQHCFAAWVTAFTGLPEGVVAIDGKTSRCAKTGGDGKADLIGCDPVWSCEGIIEHQLCAYGLRTTVEHKQPPIKHL